jgi:secondary thiamine-phosphate synthase enzyme
MKKSSGGHMLEPLLIVERAYTPAAVVHRQIHLLTSETLEFIDLTDRIAEMVEDSAVRNGLVNIQTLHTTTAIIVNEGEPLLIDDMKTLLERMAPQNDSYHHDYFSRRTVNMLPDEKANGHAHCKALFLRTSETINVIDGQLMLGRWQRIFFIELDRPRHRSVSVMIIGR